MMCRAGYVRRSARIAARDANNSPKTRQLYYNIGTAEGASVQARIAHAEFYKVHGIKDHARECLALRRSEAAWNAMVHEPLLELALSRRHTSVIYGLIVWVVGVVLALKGWWDARGGPIVCNI